MNAREAALLAACAADDKKATDIMVQDVSELLKVTDYFVIVTGSSPRQVDGIVDGITETLRDKADMRPHFIEGRDELTWVLLDYGSFVVHVFQPNAREYYRLETLWGDAPLVDLADAGILDPVFSDRIATLVASPQD